MRWRHRRRSHQQEDHNFRTWLGIPMLSLVVGVSAILLSVDHKPDRSNERERIEQAGGFVIWAGTWRVGGVLAVSRAFGDKLLKPYVVAEPEIQEEKIHGVDFIIIASDGLWNVLSHKDAVAIVQELYNLNISLSSFRSKDHEEDGDLNAGTTLSYSSAFGNVLMLISVPSALFKPGA
ncbi:hypothetical protein ACH5RR_026491 [Cinchona calisaya]|uniref:PPM-type phosphatase domain-containing protein n=1 Tax=Cinchona calisaya TaxID=153742 RepID=A0ABD2Z4U1_9GENT